MLGGQEEKDFTKLIIFIFLIFQTLSLSLFLGNPSSSPSRDAVECHYDFIYFYCFLEKIEFKGKKIRNGLIGKMGNILEQNIGLKEKKCFIYPLVTLGKDVK